MRRGLARLEVVMVGAVLTISGAVVTPLVTATDHANTLRCAANGRKIMAGLHHYMCDWDARFPSLVSGWPVPQRSEATAYLASITWEYDWEGYYNPPAVWNAMTGQWRYLQLADYVHDDKAWVCCNPTAMYVKRYSYGFRENWFPRSADDFVDGDRGFCSHQGVGRTIEEVYYLDLKGETACGSRDLPPYKKIIWMEYGLGAWGNKVIGTTPGVWPWVFPACPHEGGSNFAYADGHVSWQMMGQGWAPIGYTNLPIDQSQ